MRFVVAHAGARRGYAVPTIMERAGMLERFYTDICANAGMGRLILSLPSFGLKKAERGRLASRHLPRDIVCKTRTFVAPNLKFYFSPERFRGPAGAFLAEAHRQRELGRRMASDGFGKATWLHSFLDEFPTLIIAAKERGLGVVSEIYILLSSDRLLREERHKFSSWEDEPPDYEQIYKRAFGERVLFTHTDFVLCPSEAVRNDAVQNFGFAPEQCRIVPYGVSEHWFHVTTRPKYGRVIFVGTADLRKGIHYFAMAAEILKTRGFKYEFRVAGSVLSAVTNQRVCRHLNFLGCIPRDEVGREFAEADILVLPSLAEGSAGVTYESLACGVPAVTTPEAGSVVRDGIEGRIVPSRDPDALADAIEEIVEDRDKREQMARASRERAREFTWERYGERLVLALKSIATQKSDLVRV